MLINKPNPTVVFRASAFASPVFDEVLRTAHTRINQMCVCVCAQNCGRKSSRLCVFYANSKPLLWLGKCICICKPARCCSRSAGDRNQLVEMNARSCSISARWPHCSSRFMFFRVLHSNYARVVAVNMQILCGRYAI